MTETGDSCFLKLPPGFGERHVCWTADAAVPRRGAVDLRRGVHVDSRFPDPEGILETAWSDLRSVLRKTGCGSPEGIPLSAVRDPGMTGESFRLEVGSDGIGLSSGTLEGLRRGIYHLSSSISASPWLTSGKQEHSFRIRNRISRCFFGPIKRPPFNRDELLDDIDYYPEDYLNRLAAEGVNGLWISVCWSELSDAGFEPKDRSADRRLAKLRRTVEKCRRYGIRIWLFSIEPESRFPGDPLLKKFPELAGARGYDRICICPSSRTAERYISETLHSIFAAVPGLGGLINIMLGEHITSCLSSTPLEKDAPVLCPRCGPRSKGEVFHSLTEAMMRGIRSASPDAGLIAWLYLPSEHVKAPWVHELAAAAPRGVTVMANFESAGMLRQLERIRRSGDYWLSYAGPGEDFRRFAAAARKSGTRLGAKLQTGCSHEVATVPFVPVPGLLYRKYRKLRELGVGDVLCCWYFGGNPGLMNRCAGKLAEEKIPGSEAAFLRASAAESWGDSADQVVRAWQEFGSAYRNYPFSNMMQYYGPAHAGVVWTLSEVVKTLPLAPTWQTGFPLEGDTVGECLGNYTLEEAVELTGRLADGWERGNRLLKPLRHKFGGDPERRLEMDIAEALEIQFGSMHGILKFYDLRRRLYCGSADAGKAMAEIAAGELKRRRRLLELCREEPLLGFHPEAECHLYDAEKLRASMPALEKLAGGIMTPAPMPVRECCRVNSGCREQSDWSWKIDGECRIRIKFRPRPSMDYDAIWIQMLDRFGTVSPLLKEFDLTHRRGKIDFQMPVGKFLFGSPAVLFRIVRVAFRVGRPADIEAWPGNQSPPPHRLRLGMFAGNVMGELRADAFKNQDNRE